MRTCIFAIFIGMMYTKFPIQIISGGQTGVDRAALDFALDNNIPCGGWCPRGRMAEDGSIPDKYPLKEIDDPSYAARTKKNLLEGDGTLVLYIKDPDKGTKLTIEYCRQENKPILSLQIYYQKNIEEASNWIQENQIRKLNIAGPRASSEPEIYQAAYEFLKQLFIP